VLEKKAKTIADQNLSMLKIRHGGRSSGGVVAVFVKRRKLFLLNLCDPFGIN
jgi:hypothetical protein